MKYLVSLLILAFNFTSPSAYAEYRAFELRIYNEQAGTERLVRSTLDDIQYPTYNPLSAGEQIQIVETWRCWGNTSNFRKLCLKPAEREAQGEGDSAAKPRTRSVPPPTT